MSAFRQPSALRGLPPAPSNDVDPPVDTGAPSVGEAASPLPLILGFVLIVVVAAGAGATLLNRPGSIATTPLLAAPVDAVSAEEPPELEFPRLPEAEPVPVPPPPPVVAPRPAALPDPFPAPAPFRQLPGLMTAPGRNLGAPALIVDFGRAPSAAGAPAAGAPGGAVGRMPAAPGAGRAAGGSDDMQKLALDGGGDQPDRVNAIRLERPQSVVVQGTIIPGVLETAIDSDLPGYARATVSLDVLSFDRSNVLIPRGSRLIGRYESDLVPGQSRVFVVWTRLVRPDGASVQLASPVTDTLGRGGLEGKVDRRLFERYGGSALLSTLNAGLTALTPQQSTQVIVGSSTGAAQVQGKGQEVSPVVRIAQGAPIRIFVARDLDFSAVGGASLPTVVASAPK